MRKLVSFFCFSAFLSTAQASDLDIASALQKFVGTYQVKTCKLGGLLLPLFRRTEPCLDRETPKASDQFQVKLGSELIGDFYSPAGAQFSNFGIQVHDLSSINKGRIITSDNNWGSRFSYRTSLTERAIHHSESGDAGSASMKWKDKVNKTLSLSFTPAFGLNLSCTVVRIDQ